MQRACLRSRALPVATAVARRGARGGRLGRPGPRALPWLGPAAAGAPGGHRGHTATAAAAAAAQAGGGAPHPPPARLLSGSQWDPREPLIFEQLPAAASTSGRPPEAAAGGSNGGGRCGHGNTEVNLNHISGCPLPTAVIFCWLGARPAHVLKYSALYASLGHRCLTVVPAWPAVLAPALAAPAARSVAARLATHLRVAQAAEPPPGAGGAAAASRDDGAVDRRATDSGAVGGGGGGSSLPPHQQPLQPLSRPVVIQAMSGGGFLFLSRVLQEAIAASGASQGGSESASGSVQGRLGAGAAAAAPAWPAPEAVRGFVFDSTPGAISGDAVARALAAIIKGEAAPPPTAETAAKVAAAAAAAAAAAGAAALGGGEGSGDSDNGGGGDSDGTQSGEGGRATAYLLGLGEAGTLAHDLAAASISASLSSGPGFAATHGSGGPPGFPSPRPLPRTLLERLATAYLARPPLRAALRAADAAWAGPPLAYPAPALFLYSADDTLVYPHDVEAFMARQRAAGRRRIDAFQWAESPHVGHLRAHPAEYSEALARFLRSLALEGSRSDGTSTSAREDHA